MKIVGIDYGHGETSAGYVDSATVIGNDIPMLNLKIVGDHEKIPSIICHIPNDGYIIDPTAGQLARVDKVGICFKAPLIGNERYAEISSENKVFFKEFLSKVYKEIVSNVNNPLHVGNGGDMNFKVYIACPSGWNEEQINEYKKFVRGECNIPLIDIIKESRAAYIAARRKVGGGIRTQGGNVLVIDFGSSTIDFTYFNNDTKFEPIHEGYPYGASQVEQDVLEYLIKNDSTAKENLDILVKRCGKTKAWNLLLFEFRKLKEAYFSQGNNGQFNPSVHLRDLLLDKDLTGKYIETSQGFGFTKQQLTEVILKEYINSLSEMLDDFKEIEGVEKIDKVILTGGASRMFFFKDLITEKYGVSKKDNTLIVDLNPSYTISQGIAAFGYMNEQSKLSEKSLIDAEKDWIDNQMPQLLKKTIEKCIGDMYYEEFSKITNKYGCGRIIKNDKHNLDGLEDEIISLLNSWTAGGDAMSNKIGEAVKVSMMSSIGEKLTDFANTWGFNACISDFTMKLELNIQASLTPESCKSLIQYTWDKLREFINMRDFWDWNDNTSPYKDRKPDDRKSIERNLNDNFRSYFNDLEYISSLDDEINSISASVRDKVKDFIDNAKLQQYR